MADRPKKYLGWAQNIYFHGLSDYFFQSIAKSNFFFLPFHTQNIFFQGNLNEFIFFHYFLAPPLDI